MNGEGVLQLVEKLELDRNPGWSRERIAQEYRRTLGVDTVIWLGKGLYEEEIRERLPGGLYAYGTGGHVDTFARFADPRAILLAEVTSEERERDPILRETYARMEENRRLLSEARDCDGRPFRIVRVPEADQMS